MTAAGEKRTGHGSGTAPLPAEHVVGASPVFKEPRLIAGRLLWLEQRPAERGRTTLLMARAGADALELTPELDLRSRIHGYGGGVHAEAGDTAVVVAEGGRALWRLDLPGGGASGEADTPPAAPQRLTPATDPAQGSHEAALFGDGLIDLARQRWIGVCEADGRDRLVSVPLAGGAPRLLWESPDFCGYAVLSPSGSHLAWVSWQQPCMPWERSQLWLGRFDAAGALVDVRVIAGSTPDSGQAISLFQPLWAGADLVVANDHSGWWNLEVLADATGLMPTAEPSWRPLLPMQAEFAMPQWVYGMRTTAWDGQRLLAAACRDGRWELGALVPAGEGETTAGPSEPTTAADQAAAQPEQTSTPASDRPHPPQAARSAETGSGLQGPLRWQPIPLPFDDLAALDAEDGRLTAIASGPAAGPGLLELTLLEADSQALAPSRPNDIRCRWTHRPAAPPVLASGQISVPEALWLAGHGGRSTHALYYPPQGGDSPSSPLLIRAHSGPTGMARTGLSLAIQFWTSRGWGVVDVNYGGSTGFGRAYRERLDGGWGVVDVDDCLAAARAVVESGRADPARIAMEGSSASGFTVLAAMARSNTIRAGAIRYPVTDLTALAEGDHRFEARYFDALVGPWPEARSLYEQRSPLNQVERIHAPLLFFHGLDDAVVPAQQSIAMVERLRQQGVPVELELFEGEGHGFRDAAVQRRVLERSEAFFRDQFALPEPG